jgi:Na+-transporting methylmalonyl-CoA/oxaloacetate decarboxylase gamma subunit
LSVDWELVIKIAGGGYGITILVLLILAIVAWLVGLVLQRTAKDEKGGGTEKGEG